MFYGPAYAEVNAVNKFKDYLPEQILDIPEKDRSESVPMMFIGAANLAASPYGDLSAQANLNTLMYNGLGNIEEAKRNFQTDLGEEPTGKLTVWQIHVLGYRASRQNMTYVSFFPFNFGGEINEKFAKVQGTLKIIDENIAYPINHVTIKCQRDKGICDYSQVVLMLPDESSWAQSYNVAKLTDETYKVTRWEDNQIDAVPLGSGSCRINQLSFNFESGEFYEIAKNNTATACETNAGVSLPQLEKPRISKIVDGRSIVDDEFQKISDEAYAFLASDFRSRIDALANNSD